MRRNGDLPNTKPALVRREAIIYARVSSREQEKEGYSIDAQLRLLRTYGAEHGFVVLQEITDVETAKRTGRTGFGQMVGYLRKTSTKNPEPRCRTILVEKTDRLYRNLKDWVTIEDLDLEIHFVKESVVLTPSSRSAEKFMHGIKVLMAKNYIDNLGEEVKKGMGEKASQGHFPSRAPLGYRNVRGPDGRKTIEPDPEISPLVARLFEWYATGHHSVKQVAAMARDAGLRFRKSGAPVPTATIHHILRNPLYMGQVAWDGAMYHGEHVPLVSRELWEQVRGRFEERLGTRFKVRKHEFAFGRLVTCGYCGCAIVGEIKKGRYVYYHCTGFKGNCPKPYVREEVLEDHFNRLLDQLVFDGEVIRWVSDALRQSHGDEKREREEAVARLRKEYDRLQARIDAMYVDKLDGVIEAEYFDRKSLEWRAEQERISGAIGAHERANESYVEDGIQLLELAQRAAELFRRQVPSEKRRLLRLLLSNCSWRDGQLSTTFRQPFDLIVAANGTHDGQTAAEMAADGHSERWSGRSDSNRRPPDPQSGALSGKAHSVGVPHSPMIV